MEFRKSIRDKYQRELKIDFTEDNWESFLLHREKHKKRPRGFLPLFLGIGAITLMAGLWWAVKSSVGAPLTTSLNMNPEPIALAADTRTLQNKPSQIKTDILENQATIHIKTDVALEEVRLLESQEEIPVNDDQVKTLTQFTSIGSGAKPSSTLLGQSAISMDKTLSQNQIMKAAGQVESQQVESKIENHNLSKINHERTSHDLLIPLQHKNFSVSLVNISTIETGVSHIDIPQESRWIPGKTSVAIYGGLAKALQIGTLDEQMHQFGGQIRYNLTPKLRTKLGVEFSAVDFVATEMNPQIGVDFVESPSDLVAFSEAVVESAGINVDLGMDYLLWRNKHLHVYAGAAYRLSKEILKGIEYEFSGDDDSASDDDIFISSDRSSRYFEPLNLNLTLGISYQVKNNGFQLSLGRPLQLSRSKINLLDQIQFNFGLTRRF